MTDLRNHQPQAIGETERRGGGQCQRRFAGLPPGTVVEIEMLAANALMIMVMVMRLVMVLRVVVSSFG